MVDFRILGPLEVISDDGTKAKVPPRERAFLAVLLLFAGVPCSREMLVRVLWGDSAPADPAAALRVCASRARRALGPANCVTTLDGGFRADPAPGELDLARFRSLLSEADTAGGRGDMANAASALERALACWAYPPLADLPDSPEVAAERARLLGQRRLAELALTDTLLALGQHERIVADLHAMVVAYPLSERAWAQLMVALHLCGRRSEALAAYAKARSALRPPRGGDPRGELQAVLSMVLEDWPPEEAARSLTGSLWHRPAAQAP